VNIGALLLLFPRRLISLRGDVEWPARSPDLSPCDVFLWGYLKEKVFKHRPRSREDLKERIQQEIDSIPPELTPESYEELPGTSSAMCCQRRMPYV